jgi:hypothetical protein
LLLKAKREGRIEGLKLPEFVFISHLLFVDDLTLFGKGSIRELS